MKNKTVCVVGLGYIGLPTAALLASNGYDVRGVDINEHTVDIINRGCIHIVEPDLDAYVRSAVSNQKLKAYISPQSADIYMICVPTPFHEGHDIPMPNINYVLSAVKSISPLIKSGDLVILESTSPVGTTQAIKTMLKDCNVDVESISIAYCPERVLPGKIMIELVQNDRIIGGLSEQATKEVAMFYRTFVKGEVFETDAPTAEMCKLAENSYRDVNIAFANELSMLCANADIDAQKLIKLANHHPRVNILQPGVGVGGHCIAVDPWFIVARDPENAKLIRAAREVNNAKANWVISRIKKRLDALSIELHRAPILVCLGLAFKPNIDDLRESPAMQVVKSLYSAGYNIKVVEPNIDSHEYLDLIDLSDSLLEADIIAILVNHREFSGLLSSGIVKKESVLDFCGLCD